MCINEEEIESRTFPTKEFVAVFPRKGKRSWKLPYQLDYLGDMIVIFAVSGTRLGIKKIVAAGQQLEDLGPVHVQSNCVKKPDNQIDHGQ